MFRKYRLFRNGFRPANVGRRLVSGDAVERGRGVDRGVGLPVTSPDKLSLSLAGGGAGANGSVLAAPSGHQGATQAAETGRKTEEGGEVEVDVRPKESRREGMNGAAAAAADRRGPPRGFVPEGRVPRTAVSVEGKVGGKKEGIGAESGARLAVVGPPRPALGGVGGEQSETVGGGGTGARRSYGEPGGAFDRRGGRGGVGPPGVPGGGPRKEGEERGKGEEGEKGEEGGKGERAEIGEKGGKGKQRGETGERVLEIPMEMDVDGGEIDVVGERRGEARDEALNARRLDVGEAPGLHDADDEKYREVRHQLHVGSGASRAHLFKI